MKWNGLHLFSLANLNYTHDDCIFSYVHVWTDWSSRNNRTLANEHMLTNYQWEKCDARVCNTKLEFTSDCQSYPLEYYAYPVLNCLYAGRMTAFWLITQYRPVRTFDRSPRIIAPVWTITLPFKTIFCDPHNTVFRLTLLPDACNDKNENKQFSKWKRRKLQCSLVHFQSNHVFKFHTVSMYSSLSYVIGITSILPNMQLPVIFR